MTDRVSGDADTRKIRKPGHLNAKGAYICEPCSNGEHRGIAHVGLCQCTCDQMHDSNGDRTEDFRG